MTKNAIVSGPEGEKRIEIGPQILSTFFHGNPLTPGWVFDKVPVLEWGSEGGCAWRPGQGKSGNVGD
jgi:hypothetical protein